MKKVIKLRFAYSEEECKYYKGKQFKKLYGDANMKATGIVRRIDDLGRVVIPKEIRRTMRIREGDPSLMTLTRWERFCLAVEELDRRAVSDDT